MKNFVDQAQQLVGQRHVLQYLVREVADAVVLRIGHALDAETGELTARVLALALVAAGALGYRAIRAERPDWWGDAPAYLVTLAIGTILGMPFLGLVCAALYATVTLALAIEALRTPV